MSGRTISGFLSVLSGKLGATLLGVFITPILVRVLGSELYGDYALLLSLLAFITTITHAGISAGIRKFIAENRELDSWQDWVFAFYIRIAMVLALGAAVVLTLFGRYGPVEELFGEAFGVYFQFLALVVVTGQLFYVTRYTLMGLSREHISEPLIVARQFLYGILGLSLAYVGYDIVGVLTGTAVAALTCGIVAVWFLRPYVDLRSAFSSVPRDFSRWELLSFNIYNTIFILLTISLYNLDILLLQPIAGSEATGLYKAALVIAEFLWLVPQAVQIVFIHSASERWSRGEIEKISEMASVATRFTLTFTLLLMIGLAGLATEFMTLYFGAKYDEAVIPMLLLLPGVLGFAIARPIYAIGQGKGELRILIIGTGFAALINLVLNVLLIPQYGMVGAAIATSIGYGSMLVLHISAARRIGFDPVRDLQLSGICIASIVTSVAVFGSAFLIDSRITALVIVPPIGFVTYVIVSLRLDVVSAEELRLLEEQLPDRLAKIVRHVSDVVQ
ncbi:lipopolysaccharide biosynthesis protein [Halosegnis longus]|uniref:Flippase n=1 Tax=Halosegnis longus TaxID=2216012 RepID=A0AAJ4RA05_9EURY|nr:flippase [Salella cibi]